MQHSQAAIVCCHPKSHQRLAVFQTANLGSQTTPQGAYLVLKRRVHSAIPDEFLFQSCQKFINIDIDLIEDLVGDVNEQVQACQIYSIANRRSNSLNNLGLISSLLFPSTVHRTFLLS